MLRDISARRFAFLAGGPMLADALGAMTALALNLLAVSVHVPPRTQAWIMAIFASVYAVSSHFAGRWTTQRRATVFLLLTPMLMAAVTTTAILVPNFTMLLVLSAALGIILAHYFVPFQVKMGQVKPFTTLAWTIAFYNISWGSGYAIGTFLSGWLEAMKGWLVALAWMLAAAQVLLAVLAERSPATADSEYHPQQAFFSTPALRRCGWLAILVGNGLFGAFVMTLWPSLAKLRQLTGTQVGVGAFMVSIQLALWAFVWPRVRKYMVRPWLLAFLLLVEGGAFYELVHVSWPAALVPMIVFGIGVSGVFYHAVFYSNADPDRPGHSVGTNEFLIGAGNALGPLALGKLAGDNAGSFLPFTVGAGLAVLAALGIVAIWLANHRAAPRRLEDTPA